MLIEVLDPTTRGLKGQWSSYTFTLNKLWGGEKVIKGTVIFIKVQRFLTLSHILKAWVRGRNLFIGRQVTVSQDFLAFFPMKLTNLGPLINRLKWFCLKIRFLGDMREISYCAESDSVQANPARSFACIIFFFAGLSLPWNRILN